MTFLVPFPSQLLVKVVKDVTATRGEGRRVRSPWALNTPEHSAFRAAAKPPKQVYSTKQSSPCQHHMEEVAERPCPSAALDLQEKKSQSNKVKIIIIIKNEKCKLPEPFLSHLNSPFFSSRLQIFIHANLLPKISLVPSWKRQNFLFLLTAVPAKGKESFTSQECPKERNQEIKAPITHLQSPKGWLLNEWKQNNRTLQSHSRKRDQCQFRHKGKA